MAGKRMNYSKRRLMRALNSVKEGKYKICEAAKIFQIPRQTLADKIKGRRPAGYCRPGPQAVLGTDIESRIESWLLENSKCGFPVSREAIEFSVRHIIDRIPESARSSIPFKNNTPGKGWFKSFRKRHPQVEHQMSESPFKNKLHLTNDDLQLWHNNIEELLEEKCCCDLMEDPGRIWVMNDVTLSLDRDNSLSLLKRKKSQYIASRTYNENTFTVFLTTNAQCNFAPPLIITRNSDTFDHLASLVSGKWGVVSSDSCLLTMETFYQYVVNLFYPNLIENGIVFPIVVFVIEEFFCTSLPLMEFCRKNDIIFVAIPRKAAEFLNPLNTTTEFPLGILKKPEDVKLCYDSNSDHPVVSLIEDILTNTNIKNHIVDKFNFCNIYPFSYTLHIALTDKHGSVSDFDSKIPVEIVTKFRDCKSKNIPWNGPKKYLELYDNWRSRCELRPEELRDDAEYISSQLNEDDLDDFIVEEEEIEMC